MVAELALRAAFDTFEVVDTVVDNECDVLLLDESCVWALLAAAAMLDAMSGAMLGLCGVRPPLGP